MKAIKGNILAIPAFATVVFWLQCVDQKNARSAERRNHSTNSAIKSNATSNAQFLLAQSY